MINESTILPQFIHYNYRSSLANIMRGKSRRSHNTALLIHFLDVDIRDITNILVHRPMICKRELFFDLGIVDPV